MKTKRIILLLILVPLIPIRAIRVNEWKLCIDTLSHQAYLEEIREDKSLAPNKRIATAKYDENRNALCYDFGMQSTDKKGNGMQILMWAYNQLSSDIYGINDTVFYASSKMKAGGTMYLRFTIKRQPRVYVWDIGNIRQEQLCYIPSAHCFAKILKVSNDYVSSTMDDSVCNQFRIVRIEMAGKQKWVDGRLVYGLYNSRQVLKTTIDGIPLEFYPTAYFGMPDANDEGITWCESYNYAIMKVNGKPYPLQLDETRGEVCPYVQMTTNHNEKTCASSLWKTNGIYHLQLSHCFMEGFADTFYSIKQDGSDGYIAHKDYSIIYSV